MKVEWIVLPAVEEETKTTIQEFAEKHDLTLAFIPRGKYEVLCAFKGCTCSDSHPASSGWGMFGTGGNANEALEDYARRISMHFLYNREKAIEIQVPPLILNTERYERPAE